MYEWLVAQNSFTIYGVLFALLMSGAIGLPVPEDLPLLLGGVLLHDERVEVRVLFGVCYGSILLSDLVIFWIGRWFGATLFQKSWFKARVSPEKIHSLKQSLEKRSLFMILVARHLFYLRTVTFLTCGAVRMKTWRFLISDAVAALVSVPIMIALGFLAADQYESMHQQVKTFNIRFGIVVAVLAAVFFLIRYLRRTPAPNEK